MAAHIQTLSVRVARARFGLGPALFGSVAWGLLVGAAIALALVFFRGYGDIGHVAAIVSLYSVGAAFAFVPAVFSARIFMQTANWKRVFLICILMGFFTLGSTAVLLALEYRVYFSQWHAPAFSKLWLWQQAFTTAGAFFQYAVIGLRFYFPFAIAALFAISLWANRLAH